MIKVLLSNLNYLKSIIHWMVWWIIALSVILVLILLSFMLPTRILDIIIRAGCFIMTYSTFIIPRKKYLGSRDLPFPVVFTANHVSFFDLFIAGSVLPGNPRGVELYSHFFTPIYGWFITRFGQISIQAGNLTSLRCTLRLCSEILKNKIRNIYLAPEGSRTGSGKIADFKNGAFHISMKNNIPIVPVVYKGLFEKNNKNSILINYGFFDVILLPPVYPENFKSEDELKNEVRDRMIKALSYKQ